MKFTPQIVLIKLINLVSATIIVGLLIRFFFRLFGANTDAGFVEFVYESTSTLLDPFRGIFTPYVIEPGNVFEFSTIVAIVIYSIVAWLLVELISYISYTASSTYRSRN